MNTTRFALRLVVPAVLTLAAASDRLEAALSFNVATTGWPNAAHRDAAVAAAQSAVNRYNAYGNFGNYNIHVYYNAGIPTAQANYLGSVGFGGTYPNERVMMHEMSHYLGTGTYGTPWDGPRGEAIVDQFDGLEATLAGDSAHYWPYGLNYDSEGSEIAKQRHVALLYAMRADMGIGSAANPWSATVVNLTGTDPFGESGFNYKSRWSDGYFAHAGAAYHTGNFAMRTPESSNSFTFAGDSLTLSSNAIDTGLYFKGLGTSGVVKFNNLILNGGWIDHRSSNGVADLFQLDGKVTISASSTIRALNGNINILADVVGSGTITIPVSSNPTESNRYVRFMSDNNDFTGSIVNASRFELAQSSNFTFEIGASGVNNSISGASARNTLLNGVFEFDFSGASANVGDSWSLVTAANTTYGPQFNIPGFSKAGSIWSNGTYSFSQATGTLTLVTSWAVDGSGDWNNPSSWTAGVPTSGGDATLGPKLTSPNAPAIVNLDIPVSLNRLTINNPNKYTVGGGNSLTLVGSATVDVKAGTHEIAAPVAGSAGLNKTGLGTLTLSAANPYSGNTNIEEGTLALAGSASIANSANVNVRSNATLNVSALASAFELASAQSLNTAAGAAVLGNVVAKSGSTLTGSGDLSNTLTMQGGSTLRIGAATLPISSAPVLVDNFDTYNNATNVNIGSHANGDVTGGKWDGVFDGTNNGQVVDNANPANNALVAFGVPAQGAGGWRGAVTNLASNFSSNFSLPDGASATYFYQVMNEGNAFTDTMTGLSSTPAAVDITNAWQDFSVMPFVTGNPGSAQLRASGQLIAPLVDGQWQNVWLVVDNDNKTYDVFTSTGANPGTLALNNVAFSVITNPVDLMAFALVGRENGQVRIDNLYTAAGENTSNPLTPGSGVVYAPEVLSVAGDVVLQDGSTVVFNIAGSGINDLLDVDGELVLGGTLQVIRDSLAPALELGDTFDLFDFATASGAFDELQLPVLAGGLSWSTQKIVLDGTLEVVRAGDHNGDGAIDILDYVVWRSSGAQNAQGYTGWINNFGSSNGSGSSSGGGTAAVPEPSAAILVILVGVAFSLTSRRTQRRR